MSVVGSSQISIPNAIVSQVSPHSVDLALIRAGVEVLKDQNDEILSHIIPSPLYQNCLPCSNFIERELALEELSKLLSEPWDITFPTRTKALVGREGYGKRELALFFAQLHKDKFSLIYVIDADSDILFEEGYRDLSTLLQLNSKQKTRDKLIQDVHGRLDLGFDKPWLLIFCNLKNHLALPEKGGCVILTTTNEKLISDKISRIAIKPFSIPEIQKLYDKTFGKPARSATNFQEFTSLEKKLKKEPPLIMNLAVRYMACTGLSIGNFLESIDEDVEQVIPKVCNYLKQKNSRAFAFLSMAVNLNPNRISFILVNSWIESQKSQGSFNSISDDLNELGLAICHPSLKRLSIHRLIQTAFQNQCQSDIYFTQAIQLIYNEAERFDPNQKESWHSGKECAIHVESLKASPLWEQNQDIELKAKILKVAAIWLRLFEEANLTAERYHEEASNLTRIELTPGEDDFIPPSKTCVTKTLIVARKIYNRAMIPCFQFVKESFCSFVQATNKLINPFSIVESHVPPISPPLQFNELLRQLRTNTQAYQTSHVRSNLAFEQESPSPPLSPPLQFNELLRQLRTNTQADQISNVQSNLVFEQESPAPTSSPLRFNEIFRQLRMNTQAYQTSHVRSNLAFEQESPSSSLSSPSPIRLNELPRQLSMNTQAYQTSHVRSNLAFEQESPSSSSSPIRLNELPRQLRINTQAYQTSHVRSNLAFEQESPSSSPSPIRLRKHCGQVKIATENQDAKSIRAITTNGRVIDNLFYGKALITATENQDADSIRAITTNDPGIDGSYYGKALLIATKNQDAKSIRAITTYRRAITTYRAVIDNSYYGEALLIATENQDAKSIRAITTNGPVIDSSYHEKALRIATKNQDAKSIRAITTHFYQVRTT